MIFNPIIKKGGIDTSDATASARDILSGKTAYVNGEKVTGNIDIMTGSDIFLTSQVTSALKAGVTVPAGYYEKDVLSAYTEYKYGTQWKPAFTNSADGSNIQLVIGVPLTLLPKSNNSLGRGYGVLSFDMFLPLYDASKKCYAFLTVCGPTAAPLTSGTNQPALNTIAILSNGKLNAGSATMTITDDGIEFPISLPTTYFTAGVQASPSHGTLRYYRCTYVPAG